MFTGARGNPQIIESNDALISAAPTVADIPVSNISLNGSAVDTSPLGQTTTTTGTVSYTSETINGQTHDVMKIAEGATGINSVSVPSGTDDITATISDYDGTTKLATLNNMTEVVMEHRKH